MSGLSLRAAHATAGSNTTLVIEGDVPLTTAATILSEFQMTNSLGSVSFLHPPSVYGFQPVGAYGMYVLGIDNIAMATCM